MGNPFSENSNDFVLDSRNIVDAAVEDNVPDWETQTQPVWDICWRETMSQKIPIAEPLKRNNLQLFNWPPIREKSCKQLQLSSLKNNCSLFSRLYITSQICNGDLGEFFKHENQPYPPHCHRWMLWEQGWSQTCWAASKTLLLWKRISPVPQCRSPSLMVLPSSTCCDLGMQRRSRIMPLMFSCITTSACNQIRHHLGCVHAWELEGLHS